ncbi:hypothetical protein [Nitratiruptor tergarcus]|uniref:Transposase n=1 Tax=Nitratiruptor tergarcus DSM 16512 TaxID=1069081 RepID=A0A1W1WU31_9BACT|nr:hypothetical protein [Nitratiruptor tergarcus]SMC09787.1 hypothetical protein SAMN05660197_1609 [Nitratiruptor tergarcus DSM 16512]
MRCIYCNAPTYLLGNGNRKCKICKRKFSPAKIARKEKIIECFCKDLSVNECMRRSGYNYVTIKSYYDAFRKKIAAFMEEEYLNRQETRAYEEYIYLENSKDPKKDIFDGYNFLTFDYGGRIYNLLMPDLSRFKPYFSEDGLNEVYYKEFKNFLRISKLQKNSQNRLIYDFWSYLEDLLPKYRGIKRENFFYYLKEAEFKFNFDCEKLKEIV